MRWDFFWKKRRYTHLLQRRGVKRKHLAKRPTPISDEDVMLHLFASLGGKSRPNRAGGFHSLDSLSSSMLLIYFGYRPEGNSRQSNRNQEFCPPFRDSIFMKKKMMLVNMMNMIHPPLMSGQLLSPHVVSNQTHRLE